MSLFLMCSVQSSAQNYAIGHKQITFTDPARSNRSIQTEIYYPATSAGDNTPFVAGQFPLIVFGHGFVMAWSSYQWMWDSIVPHGFIMAFPRTEGSMIPTPDHAAFGLDLAFLNDFIKSENSNSSSFFYQHLSNKSAIMGHSMGGGSSFLAAENNTNLTALVNFAAANTTPSSITASSNVTIPTLIFMGENDGVAAPATNQIPMYDSCASSCKTLVTILGGGHCYFADYNFNCSFGEGTSSPQPTITMDEQHVRTAYLLIPYIDNILKNNSASGTLFMNRLNENINTSYLRSCNTTNINDVFENESFSFYPNPANDIINITINNNKKPKFVTIKDMTGREILMQKFESNEYLLNLKSLEPGSYFISINYKYSTETRILIKK